MRDLWLVQLYHTTFLANQRSKFSQALLTAFCALVWLLTSFSHRFHRFQSIFLAKRVFALLICCNVLYLSCCKCVVKNWMFVITLFLYLCGILYVLIEWHIDGLLLCRSARCFHLKMSSEVLSKLCRHKLIWVLYFRYLMFHEFCRTTESLV